MAIPGMEHISSNDNVIFNVTPKYKLYSIGAILIATLFGSVLAAGYLITCNYRRLGENAAAKKTFIFAAGVDC
ncbi:hypothetical protein [Enterobacter sp. Bisph1]|uniref:hypothetical protein n=1 Tax=Enterobacter sp. Bisph1 TaxID=1274399 RepID=UPI00057C2B35|nr:hypothetical protein [Enterobacter sp. Bisph1]